MQFFEMIDGGGKIVYHLLFYMISNFLIADITKPIHYYYPKKDCKLENEMLELLPPNFQRGYEKVPGITYTTFMHAIPVFEDSALPQSYMLLRHLYQHVTVKTINPNLRLYIVRDANTLAEKKRTFLNEEEVTQCMRNHGFQIVRLETMSVREQIQLCSQASVILGPHGAGLSYTVFCNPGVRIVEIFKPIQKPKRHFMHIAQVLGFEYHRFSDVEICDQDENMIVDVGKLDSFLSLHFPLNNQNTIPLQIMKPTNDIPTILQLATPTTRDKFEIVITRFQESLDWVKGFDHLATIYNKGQMDESTFKHIPNVNIVNTPNKGVGAETILRHIITRYDSLADVTFFAQATIADRVDQPLYPLAYYQTTPLTGANGYISDAYDPPTSRYGRETTHVNKHDYNLKQWREHIVKLPYLFLQEHWVRGDWIAVGRDAIRSKPLDYYKYLYQSCDFGRGIWLEECWFWERTFWVLFTHKLPNLLTIPKIEGNVLVT